MDRNVGRFLFGYGVGAGGTFFCGFHEAAELRRNGGGAGRELGLFFGEKFVGKSLVLFGFWTGHLRGTLDYEEVAGVLVAGWVILSVAGAVWVEGVLGGVISRCRASLVT